MKKLLVVLVFLLASPAPVLALDFSLKLEPSLAIPLSSPQSDIYKVGGGGSFKALIGLSRYLEIGPSVGAIALPSQLDGGDPGVAWMAGGGFRLMRPHDSPDGLGASPWLDADVLYVRTGPLDRLGFDVGAGLSIPVGTDRPFWLGPFVRYFQTLQPERVDFDNRDAKILMIGLSLEVDGMLGRPRPVAPAPIVIPAPECPAEKVCPQCPAAPECPPAEVKPCPQPPSDRDQDGVPDTEDACPDVQGPKTLNGCPPYQKVVVTQSKIELKEKVHFAWDKALIRPRSHGLLGDVVKVLKENKAFRVSVEGHTDSSGAEDHNQKLSESRAHAVVKYLVAHGIAEDRLDHHGYASTNPMETNATSAGREKNRRVEFVITNREGVK